MVNFQKLFKKKIFFLPHLKVWILVPLVVVPLAAYSLSRHSSKCLYPFLVISVINSIVTFCMALIVGGFSLLCFEQLKKHFGKILIKYFL